MNAYEMKQEDRKERLERRAALCERLAEIRMKRAQDMGSIIPFGQPILIGHHSESRDRNYRNRIQRNYEKSFELAKKAKYYAEKAASVGSGGISSDDPEATDKLQEKLDKLKDLQTKMVAINKLVRKKDRAALAAAPWNLSEGRINDLFTPDFCGRVGFASYQLTNNSANIRRIEERIAQLARNATRETKEITFGDARIVQNVEANRLQIFFPGKPEYEVRARLKAHGFRWAPSEGAWQRHLSNGAIHVLRYVLTGSYDVPAVTEEVSANA